MNAHNIQSPTLAVEIPGRSRSEGAADQTLAMAAQLGFFPNDGLKVHINEKQIEAGSQIELILNDNVVATHTVEAGQVNSPIGLSLSADHLVTGIHKLKYQVKQIDQLPFQGSEFAVLFVKAKPLSHLGFTADSNSSLLVNIEVQLQSQPLGKAISTGSEVLHQVESSGGLVFSPDYRHLHFSLNREILTLDMEQQTVITKYQVWGYPVAGGTSPDGRYVYASAPSNTHTWVIDTLAQTITKGYELGSEDASNIAVSADGRLLYVASNEYGTPNNSFLNIIDSATQSLVKKIEIGRVAVSLALSPDNSHVYVCCFEAQEGRAGVYAIALQTDRVTRIPVELYPLGLAFDPAKRLLYVSHTLGNTITVIDTTNNAIRGSFTVSQSPTHLTLSNDGKWLYVLRNATGLIDVFDTQHQTLTRTIDTGKQSLRDITTRKDNGDIWAAYYVQKE
ncbi:YncE family protein [Pseudomonas frederiksbergensis]|uniref:YncE family protein n=1 Tax=Pseudomonas frederiksbergensis TaxID=104087 RepID=UPI003D251E44